MEQKNKYFLLGMERYKLKDYSGAIEYFSKAISVEPSNAYIYFERGVAYFHTNNLKASLADLNKAQELQPENPYRYSSRAYIKDRMGDTAGAIADYEKAVEIDPDDAISYNNLGLLQEKLGKMKSAKKNFTKADSLAEQQNFPKIKNNQQDNILSVPASEKSATSEIRIMLDVFRKKESFKEFIEFVKNGFRKK